MWSMFFVWFVFFSPPFSSWSHPIHPPSFRRPAVSRSTRWQRTTNSQKISRHFFFGTKSLENWTLNVLDCDKIETKKTCRNRIDKKLYRHFKSSLFFFACLRKRICGIFFPSNTRSVRGTLFFLFDVRKKTPSRATLENWGSFYCFLLRFNRSLW